MKQQSKISVKVLSFLLSFAMIIGLVPLGNQMVYAAEGDSTENPPTKEEENPTTGSLMNGAILADAVANGYVKNMVDASNGANILSGRAWYADEGTLATMGQSNTPLPDGTPVYMRWRDKDNAVSPLYVTKIQHCTADNGQAGWGFYAFDLRKGFKDGRGKVHKFNASTGQYYLLYIPTSKSPAGNNIYMFRQVGGFFPGSFIVTPTDNNLGQFPLAGTNMQRTGVFMAEQGGSYMHKPQSEWKEDKLGPIKNPAVTGNSNNAICGRVWLETGAGDKANSATGPNKNGPDPVAVGYKVVVSYLTAEGAQANAEIKKMPIKERSLATKKMLENHPEYIQETKYASTDKDGYYAIRFDNKAMKNPNTTNMYMQVFDPSGRLMNGYSAYTIPVFRSPADNNSVLPQGVPGSETAGYINGPYGWYNVHFAIVNDINLTIKVTSHDMDQHPAEPGDVVKADVVGDVLPPKEFDNKVVWKSPSGKVLHETPLKELKAGTDDTWTAPATKEEAAKLGLKDGDIITVSLVSSGNEMASDSFMYSEIPTVHLHLNSPLHGAEDKVTEKVDMTSGRDDKKQLIYKDQVTLPAQYGKKDYQEIKEKGWNLVGWSTDPKATQPDHNLADYSVAYDPAKPTENILSEGRSQELVHDLYVRDGDEYVIKNNKTLTDEGNNLYAVWKKNFTVTVSKEWLDSARGELTDKYDTGKLQFGLLSRAAVGTFGQEVVKSMATYTPVKEAAPKAYVAGQEISWDNLPAYDYLGRRMSYVLVELTDDKMVEAYKNGSTNWNDYGINVVEAKGTSGQEGFQPPRKEQNLGFLKEGETALDGFTGATKRVHIVKGEEVDPHPSTGEAPKLGYFDTESYKITASNINSHVTTPIIKQGFAGDNLVKMELIKRTDEVRGVITIDKKEYKYAAELQGNNKWSLIEGAGDFKIADDSDVTHLNLELLQDRTLVVDDTVTAKGSMRDPKATSSVATMKVVDNASRLPKDIQQAHNKDGKTVITATPYKELVNGSEIDVMPKNTTYTLVDKEGKPVVDKDGNEIKGTINGDGKIEFQIPQDQIEEGKDYSIKVKEPNREAATTTESTQIDKTAPVVTLPDIAGKVGEALTLDPLSVKEKNGFTIVEQDLTQYQATADAENKTVVLSGKPSSPFASKEKPGTYSITLEDRYGNSKKYEAKEYIDSDTSQYQAKGGTINKDFGDPTKADEVIQQVTITPDYPADKTAPTIKVVNEKALPDGKKTGTFTVPVRVTYPDGTTDGVDVTVVVGKSMADTYQAQDGQITKNYGVATYIEDVQRAISYEPEYPTTKNAPKIELKPGETLPDGKTPGTTPYEVVVTYPDGSKDEATVTVTVLDKVIDRTDDPSQPTPDGYVRVTLDAGEGTQLKKGQKAKVYDVKIGSTLAKEQYPEVEVKEGYNPETLKWSVAPGEQITNAGKIESTAKANVIDRTDDPNQPTPDGYVRVTIDAGEGTQLAEGQTKKVYDVKQGTALTKDQYPVVEAKKGYDADSIAWSVAPGTAINEKTDIVSTAKANVIDRTDDPNQPTPDGYVRVTIDAGEGTQLAEGQTKKVYDVKQGTALTKDQYPKVVVAEGYQEPITWSVAPGTPLNEKADIVSTAVAKGIVDITDDPSKLPEGYFALTVLQKNDSVKAFKKVYGLPKGAGYSYADVIKKAENEKDLIVVNAGYQDHLFWSLQKPMSLNVMMFFVAPSYSEGFDEKQEAVANATLLVRTEPKEAASKTATVHVGEEAKAEDTIANKNDLPAGTKFSFVQPVDTSTTGEKKAQVLVEYPEGTKKKVDVVVNVVDAVPVPQSEKPEITPVTEGDKTVSGKGVPGATVEVTLPDGTPNGIKQMATVDKDGNWTVSVPKYLKLEKDDVVTAVQTEEGKKASEPVTATVAAAPTDADKTTPQGQDITVNKGDTPKAEDGIKNKDEMPEGTKYSFKEPVDTTTAGDKDAVVVVTYPDGSTDEVPVKVIVKDNISEQPSVNDVNEGDKTIGGKGTPGATIEVTLPNGTKVSTKVGEDGTWSVDVPEDITLKKDDKITVVQTEEGKDPSDPVEVTVGGGASQPTDANKYDPEGQNINVNKGDSPKAADGIKNKDKMPKGTKYSFKDGNPDTSEAGSFDVTVVVTYPDGTTDEVAVKLVVTETEPEPEPTDADKYDPEGQNINVNKGDSPKAADGIKNKDKMPEGTKYSFKDGDPDTTKPGSQDVTVIVTYPDGSTDEVSVKLVVNETEPEPTDADKNNPKGQDITVKPGEKPDPKDGIKNLDDLPDGTKVSFKNGDPDTTKPGSQEVVIEVTYPDGSKDEVTVKVIVKEDEKKPTDADKYDPEGQDITVKPGEKPDPKDGIKNLDDLPDGTKVDFEKPVNTDKEGSQEVTIIVTYPDGSRDRVTTCIIVKKDSCGRGIAPGQPTNCGGNGVVIGGHGSGSYAPTTGDTAMYAVSALLFAAIAGVCVIRKKERENN